MRVFNALSLCSARAVLIGAVIDAPTALIRQAVGVLALLAPVLWQALPQAVRSGFGAQRLALQLAEGVLLADLSCYFFHRACHRFDFLWSFHAVHHSAVEVDWLAAHREHPLDG